MILFILIIFLFFPIKVHADCYVKVESYQKAQQIAEEKNLILKEYSYGIASYYGDGDLPKDDIIPINSCPYQRLLFDNIELQTTYENDITGKGVVIAVLDTGCDMNHCDLKQNIIGGYNVTSDSSLMDYNGHGTHVAGIISAIDNNLGINGIAPDAKLYIVKANRNNEPYFYYSDIVRGIYKCIELGYIDIINMSFGSYYDSSILKEAILDATKHGIVVVAAAGNDGTSRPIYPAAYQSCLSVGSCNYQKQISVFSNRGINYNIIAPGEAIYSTVPGNAYNIMYGTSMAAPIISGVAALVISKYNLHHNVNMVKDIIINNSDHQVVNVQKIFNLPKIHAPDKPNIKVIENPETLQKEIILNTDKNTESYYTIDKKNPSIYSDKVNGSIILDKKGTHTLRIVSTVKNSRVYSQTKKIKINVNKKVYSCDYLKSLEISYNKNCIVIKSPKYKRLLNTKIIHWKTSNRRIIINQNGKILKFDNGTVIVTAIIGGFRKKIRLRKEGKNVNWTRIS